MVLLLLICCGITTLLVVCFWLDLLCIFCHCGEISPPDPTLWPLPVPTEGLLRLPSAGGLCEDEEEDDIFVDDC